MSKKIPKTPNEALKLMGDFAPLPPYNLGFENRHIILETSLIIEKATSKFIANLLGIKSPENSLVLGNRNSSLSLSQKIDLLIDLGALTIKDKSKFQAFMEIRNKFMHVYDANSFNACFMHLGEKEKFLFKLYPQVKAMDREEKLKEVSICLANDVLSLTYGIINSIIAKNHNERISELSISLAKTITVNSDELNKLIGIFKDMINLETQNINSDI